MNQPLEISGYGYAFHEFIVVVAICALISIVTVIVVHWILAKAFHTAARWWERLEWWFWRRRVRRQWDGARIFFHGSERAKWDGSFR